MKSIIFWFIIFSSINLISQNVTVAISTDCIDEKVISLINDHIKQQPQVKASLFCSNHKIFLIRVALNEVQIKDQFLNNIMAAFNQYQFNYKDLTDPNFIDHCLVDNDVDIKEKIKLNE